MIGQEDERPRRDMGQPHQPGDPRTGDLIGAALRDHFQDLAKAPVPDKFLLLLAELEAKEGLVKQGEDEEGSKAAAQDGGDGV
jgi:Anti-sigma factor NepR